MEYFDYKIAKNYFNMVTMAIVHCFRAPTNSREVTTRIDFANSKLLKMWCDCSDNFEYEKLRKKIIEFNLKSFYGNEYKFEMEKMMKKLST